MSDDERMSDDDDSVRSGLLDLGLGGYTERMHDCGYSDWDTINVLHHCELQDCARESGMDGPDAHTFVEGVLKLASPLQQAEVLIDAMPIEEVITAKTAEPLCLGVTCITKCPANMATWLHHFASIGVQHFFVRVEEDDGALAELFGELRWHDMVHATFAPGVTEADSGPALCSRMDRHTGRAIEHARALGCTHLLLCDDDELLYAPSGLAALHGAIKGIQTGIAELHVRVLEALYPPSLMGGASSEECGDAFQEATCFKHRPGEYSRYGWQCGSTGKSIGVLSVEGLSPAGPRTPRREEEIAACSSHSHRPALIRFHLAQQLTQICVPSQITLRSIAPPGGCGR